MVHNCTNSLLKTKQGKFFTMKKFSGSFKLCVEDIQNHPEHAYLMHVKRHEEKDQWLFYIEYENFYYVPKVHGEKVELEKCVQRNLESLDDSHWFEKLSNRLNGFCNMQSVSKPGFCLCSSGVQVSITSYDKGRLLVKEIFRDKSG